MSDGRFEVVRPLGAGGFGRVELVRDAARGELVARKRLRGSDPVRAATLTRELRIAGSLDHPNVVRVLELGQDEGGPYLLIEHVDGEDLATSCRGDDGGPRWDRLASALPQLLSALRFLHERGVAHGDLKPENVLVRRDGRLTIVDFGLATRDGEALSGGTPIYLAPERRRGAPPSAAADRWALGVMLREITARASIPELSAMIEQLLDHDPARRPSIDRIEHALLPALGATADARHTSPGEVVGREALIARVHGTLLAGQRSVVLTGPAGAGKTTVAREVARLAEAAGFTVLAARARAEARVAFHLVDELLELALPHADAEAAQTLDILRSLEPISQAAAAFLGGDAATARIRREVHERLFGARPARPRAQLARDVSALLSAPGDRVLLFIDDLQWADPDSRVLLQEMLEVPGTLSMLATSRTATGARTLEVPVPPLSHAGLTAMLVARGLDEEQAAEIARRSGGSPGIARLTEQLSALGAGLLTRSADERRVLAAVLVAGAPLAAEDLPRSAVDALCRRGLLVRDGGVELAHDALREPLAEALGDDWVRAAHLRSARELAGRADRDADRIRHLVGAGEASAAARIAPAAAARLTLAGAHGMAAELLDIAHRHGPHDLAVAEQRALALERAQRFADAAAAWAELGARSHAPDAIARFALAEALALLNARRIGEGRARLDAALVSAGEAPLGRRGAAAASTALRFLAGPLPWPASTPSRLTPAQAKGFLRSAAIVGYFDTLSGIRLLSRLRDVFDRANDAEHAAWCDYLLAFFARFLRVGGGWLSARYRGAAERRLAGRAPRIAIVRAFPEFLDAYAQLRAGRFADALAGLEVALEDMEGSGEELSFELQLVLSLRTSAVLALQNVDAAEAAVGRFEAAAREGLDVAIQCHVENARALVATWRGRFEEALGRMEQLRREWPREPVTVQSILIETYAALPAVLLGAAREARRRLREALERGRRFGIFRSAYGPIVAAIASLAEIASGEGDLARARRWATLASARPSIMQGLGERVLCYLDGTGLRAAAERAALRGQPLDAALARLIDADSSGDRASAAAARSALAELGGSARLIEEAHAVGPTLHGRRFVR